MRSGFLLLPLLALPVIFAGSSTKDGTNYDPSSTEDAEAQKPEVAVDTTCIPPVFIVIFFTAYGVFLMGLYIYGGKQWIGLMEAKFKLRKMMALDIALINYDAFCERHDLHGRAQLFIPALNDGFFLDPDVQAAWLSVNNLRSSIYKVLTADYKDIVRTNWDSVKNDLKRAQKKRKDAELRVTKKNSGGLYPKLNLQTLCHQLLAADIFIPSALTKLTEERVAEGTDNQPGTSQMKEVDGSAEHGKKDDEKKTATDPSMEKKDKSEKKDGKKDGKKEKKDEKKTKTETTKEAKRDSNSDPKAVKKDKKETETKDEKKDSVSEPKVDKKDKKKAEEKEMDKKDDKKKKGKSERKTKTDEKKEEEKEVKKKSKPDEKKEEEKKTKGKQSASAKEAKEKEKK